MSGRSPNLPIDVLLGRAQTQGQELPDYVRKTQSSLKSAFSVVRQRLHKAHQRQKQLKDQAIAGEAFQVGDRWQRYRLPIFDTSYYTISL